MNTEAVCVIIFLATLLCTQLAVCYCVVINLIIEITNNVRWMWVVTQSREKQLFTHLIASESQPETWVQFIALFLWEFWKPLWDPRSPSPVIFCQNSWSCSSHVWLMEGWTQRILHCPWDWMAGAGQGGEWARGELEPVPNPTDSCVYLLVSMQALRKLEGASITCL